MQNYNRLTIDLAAVRYNYDLILNRFPTKVRMMPMVKASSYGTDSFHMAEFFHKACGADIVGVSHVSEGVYLREKGFQLPIFVICAPFFDAETIVRYDLEPTVDSLETCVALSREAQRQNRSIKVHIHLDTGMQRFGCRIEEALQLALHLQHLPGLILEGVLTHFVGAESEQFDSLSSSQYLQFELLLKKLKEKNIFPQWIHIANSSGALRFHFQPCNMVRVGAAVLGLYSSEIERSTLSLRPALSLRSLIVGINKCQKGETVGYSQAYKATREKEIIAIIPIGYHDGLHLQYSGRGYVLIHGKKAPFVSRICMDFMMVNITDIPEAKIGDEVVIFGKDAYGNHLLPETVASWANTNVRELIACLGNRIERAYTHSTSRIVFWQCESSRD